MNEWFYAKNGQQNGPVSLDQLRELAKNGTLSTNDLVWNSSMKDWTPASQIGGLFSESGIPESSISDSINPYASPLLSGTDVDPTTLSEIIPGSEPIDPGACVKRGFDLTKRNYANILLVGLVYFAILIGLSIVSSVFQVGVAALSPQDFPAQNLQPQGFQPQNVQAQTEPSGAMIAINLVFQLIYQVLSIFLGLGLTRIGLNFLDGKKVEVGMLFGEGNKLLPAIGATILFSLMVVVGLIFLIVPGIYLALRYGQFLNGIVDRDLGVMDSFAYSSSLTTNNKMPLFILWIFCVLIFIVGMLACGIGLIFAAPVIWLSMLAAYRWMQYGHRAPSWINPAQRHRCSLANSKA